MLLLLSKQNYRDSVDEVVNVRRHQGKYLTSCWRLFTVETRAEWVIYQSKIKNGLFTGPK